MGSVYVNKPCLHCGKEYYGNRERKHCSNECARHAKAARLAQAEGKTPLFEQLRQCNSCRCDFVPIAVKQVYCTICSPNSKKRRLDIGEGWDVEMFGEYLPSRRSEQISCGINTCLTCNRLEVNCRCPKGGGSENSDIL